MGSEDIIEEILGALPAMRGDAPQTVAGGIVGEPQRLRTMAQGLTLGAADEIEAGVRAPFSDQSYGEILSDVRGKVDNYRDNNPGRAIVDEITGAIAPIAAGVFTGGSSTAASAARLPRIAKMTGIGMAEGGFYGFNSGTGGDAETYWGQMLNRAPDAAWGAVTGGIAAPVGAGLVAGTTRTLNGMIDWANRKMGPRVGKAAERELQRVIKESGLTMDEAVARIESGELLAEANRTLQTVARGYYAQDTGAAQVMSEAFRKRPDQLRSETMDYLQSTMTEGSDPNVLRQFQADDAALRKEKGRDYNRVYAEAGQVSDEVAADLADAFNRVPGAAKELDTLYRAQTGNKPFFKVTDEGIQFDRNPTLEEAEILRRGLRDNADSLFRSGSGGAGTAVRDVSEGVRNTLDDASPDLAAVRQQWSQIETAKDAFTEGRKALARSPDEVAIEFDRVSQLGDGAVKAYRAGVMDAYRRKASTGTNKSLPRLMADEERKEGAILRVVFPGDQLPELLGKAQRAAKSQEAANQILGGSQTAITQGRKGEIGGDLLADGIEAAAGSPFAAIRVASQVAKGLRPGLSDADIQQVARLMVESDPDAFKRAAIGTGANDAVVRVAENALKRFEQAGAGLARRAAVPVQQGILSEFLNGPN